MTCDRNDVTNVSIIYENGKNSSGIKTLLTSPRWVTTRVLSEIFSQTRYLQTSPCLTYHSDTLQRSRSYNVQSCISPPTRGRGPNLILIRRHSRTGNSEQNFLNISLPIPPFSYPLISFIGLVSVLPLCLVLLKSLALKSISTVTQLSLVSNHSHCSPFEYASDSNIQEYICHREFVL